MTKNNQDLLRSKKNIFILLKAILISLVLFLVALNFKSTNINNDKTYEVDISILNFKSKYIELSVKTNKEVKECAYTNFNDANKENLIFNETLDNSCLIKGDLQDYYVYFKDNLDNISDGVLVSNYLLKNDFKDVYYLAIGGVESIKDDLVYFGHEEVKFDIESNDVAKIEDDKIIGLKKGYTNLNIYIGNVLYKTSNIYVTDAITNIKENFDNKKPFLPCMAYSKEDASLIDKILFDRIDNAGYKTRAGVVAAARFITLEFPYRLKYFYENGRVHESGVNYVDGEGRYYHRGLYLDESKFASLLASSSAGPAIWGCKLTNYEDDPPLFIRLNKYPNGLDCSGFVSWVLLNGGFDVGDIGAGESAYTHQLTDTGEFMNLTQELIDNNEIRVGDLLNVPGHIAIIIGIDDTNYYVAESLNTFDGLVVKTYNRKSVKKTFPYVVLMDSVYLEDGNITKMWY